MAPVVMAAVIFWSGCTDTGDASASLTPHRVRPTTFEIALEEAGTVEATRVISITAPESARLIFLPDTGAMVKTGEVIAQLETQQAEETLQQRLNELQSVKADLEATIESLQVALRENTLNRDLAQSELEFSTLRLQDVKVRLAETEVLLESAVVPEDDVRTAQYNVDSTRLSTVTTDLSLRSQVATNVQGRAEWMSNIARNELRGRRALRVLGQAQREIEQATIRSPIDGIFIRARYWDHRQRAMAEPRPGEDIRRGQALGTIPDLNSLVVRTQIPESYLLRVQPGTRAVVEFDAHDDLALEGQVVSIGNVAIDRESSAGGAIIQTESYSGQKVFEVLIKFDDVDTRLRPGITAQVRILLDSRKGVLTIPVEAIVPDEKVSSVLVMDSNNKPQLRQIKVGDHNGSEVIVLEGLNAGEIVGVRGSANRDQASAGRRRSG
jgi:HlyD family secretion protein